MTACVHTKKDAAVVTASLVGALSLGAAPVAAMADTADTGIDLQAAVWYTDAKATDGKGGTVSNPNEATFILGSGKYLVPTEVANSMVMTPIDDTFAVVYDNDSNWASSAASTARTDSDGNPYYVGLGVGGWYKADGVDAFEITSISQTLTAEQAEAYFGGKLVDLNNTPVEVDPSPNFRVIISKDGHSVDQVFKIKAANSSQEIKLDGAVVYDGENLIGSDIVFVDESGTAISPVQWFEADGTSTTSIVNAGSYYAKFSNGQTVSFEVQALDLSSVSVVINDLQSGKGSHAGAYWNDDILDALVINGDRINATLKGQLGIAKRSNPSAYASGENTVTIARGAGLSSNIKGTASVTFTIYDVNAVDSVEYGRQTAVETTSGGYAYDTVEIWLENGMAYDESKISVKDSLGNTYTGDDLEISYSNRATGEKVDVSALAEKGKYSVNVRVRPFKDSVSGDYYGGSVSFDVDVNAMSLNSNKNLAFFFDGELSGDSASVTYDGTDQLSKLETVVKNAAGDTMEEGTDYTLEITKDGKDVESATDAGAYVVTAKPVTFDFGGSAKNIFTLTVNKVDAKRLVAATDDMMFTALDNGYIPTAGDDDNNGWTPQVVNQFFVACTGSAIELPGVKYEIANPDRTFTYPELSSDLFNVVPIKKGGKTVKEVKDEGTYTVKIALTDEAAANYQLSEDEYTVTVKSYGHFVDVDSAKLYSVPVEKA